MADPFAAALAALFRSALAIDAEYRPATGDPVSIRVIRSQPTDTTDFGDVTVSMPTNMFDIARSDVDRPAPGDIIAIGDQTFRLIGQPMLDVEGLTWRCGAFAL